MRPRSLSRFFAFCVAAVGSASAASAQCQPTWHDTPAGGFTDAGGHVQPYLAQLLCACWPCTALRGYPSGTE